ncbi:hypothetical protein Tco_0771495 [Tanacetum coccineum]|uniref:Reverse transcriptase domain-containing protein n=1 Tax=Tanacetum coccineum TaxID=301880 RepID=A0ABQ4ZF79_9ASTR
MADNRTMVQLLQAPTEGYEDAIAILEINANFELKHGLINHVQNKQFFGHDKEDPHAHIRYFNKITSTMRFPDIPSTSIKLMLFLFSLEGLAWIWLEKEPHRSILTWDDLVSKFINQFFPSSKMTNLHSLNSAAGGNFLDKMPRECLRIIESKSKVRNSRNKAVVAKIIMSKILAIILILLVLTNINPRSFPSIILLHELVREILQAQEDLIEAIQAFLKEYDHISPNEKCMALLIAEERFLKIKQTMKKEQNQPGVMQQLLLKLMDDLQILKGSQQEKKEAAAQSLIPY